MKPLTASLFALLMVLPYAAQAAAPDQVLIVGDSLSSAHRIPAQSGWVSLLEQRLATQTATPPALVNASRGGKTLADALGELPALLEAQHPDLVVLELGGNDAILGAPSQDIRRDMTKLVELSRQSGAQVAILGFDIPPAFDRDGSAQMLRNTYAQVAAELNVPLLPSLLAHVSDQPALLLDDGIHPSAEAQALVLENAWPTLRPLLLDETAPVATAASP
jgi:acyl-CoA thioesterase-1